MTYRSRPGSNGRAIWIYLGAALGLLFVLAAFSTRSPSSTQALVGQTAGHGFTLDGSILGIGVTVNGLTLPTQSTLNAPLAITQGAVSITGDNPSVTCSHSPSGLTVSASCSFTVGNLNLSISGVQIIGATSLTAESNSIVAAVPPAMTAPARSSACASSRRRWAAAIQS